VGSANVCLELPEFKLSRTLTLAAVGLCYSGPINHFWFAALEKCVQLRHLMASATLKLVIDQVMFVPVAISGYMIVRGAFEQKPHLEIYSQLQEKVPIATAHAWQFWPFANFLSFSVVPVIYRVLFGNVCALFWNAKLSLITSQPGIEDQTGLEAPATPRNRHGSFDEVLPTCGFDETWALGSASGHQDIYGATAFDETMPSHGFDEAWALESAQSPKALYKTGYNHEMLPTSGFDETWALGAASNLVAYRTCFDEMLPTHGFDETSCLTEQAE
jgi:protein Mpv17